MQSSANHRMLTAAVIGCSLLALICGCATKTSRQLEIERLQLQQQQKAAVVQKQNKRAVTDQEKRALDLKRRRDQLAAAQKRNAEIERAGSLVRGGNGELAVEVLNAVLEQNERSIAAEAMHKAREAREKGAKGGEVATPDVGNEAPTPSQQQSPAAEVASDGAESVDEEETLPPPLTSSEAAVVYLFRGTAYYQVAQHAAAKEVEPDFEPAIADYKKALELDRSLRDARVNLAGLYFSNRQFGAASEMYKKDLEQGFRSGETLFRLAQCYFELYQETQDAGHLEGARLAIQAAMVERPRDDVILRWMALLEFQTSRYPEAIRIFKQILKQNPLDPEYLGYLSRCYLDTAQYQDAVDTLELLVRAEKSENNRRGYYKTLGDLYGVLGLPERAAMWYRKAKPDVDRMSPEERYNIGLLYADAGLTEEAVEWLTTLKKGESKYAEGLRRMGYLQRDQGDDDAALASFEEAREAAPQMAAVHLIVGDMQFDRKQFDKARDAYSRAQGFDETVADGYAGCAECFYEEGNLKQAASYYEKAIKSRPEDRRFQVALEQIKVELELDKTTASQ